MNTSSRTNAILEETRVEGERGEVKEVTLVTGQGGSREGEGDLPAKCGGSGRT